MLVRYRLSTHFEMEYVLTSVFYKELKAERQPMLTSHRKCFYLGQTSTL